MKNLRFSKDSQGQEINFRTDPESRRKSVNEGSYKRGNEDEVAETMKNQYKLYLSMDHNILRAMVSADKEQEALKDHSSLSHGFKRMSAGMKILRSTKRKNETLHTVQENLTNFIDKTSEKGLRNTLVSQQKWLRTDRERWIKTRGSESFVHDSKGLKVFLRKLFFALDEEESGKLAVHDIVFPLLAFGLCPDGKYIESAVKMIFKQNDVKKIVVHRDEFINMFEEDSKTDHILESLDIRTKAITTFKDPAKRARCESAPLQNFHEEDDIKAKFKYCEVEDYLKVLKFWWKELKPEPDSVHSSKVSEFLSYNGFVANKHEGMRLLKGITSSNLIYYIDFERIFVKSIFKATLVNLASALNNGELDINDASLRLKLSNYERSQMIKGTSPQGEYKSAKTTLQVISKYETNQNFPSLENQKIAKTIQFVEDAHKKRLKTYLYKLNTKAKEFIDDKGNIISNYSNPWDIRDIVSTKYSKRVSTTLDEEHTFDQLKYLKGLTNAKQLNLNLSKVPIPRKVKRFREDFTLEKYQKLIEKP